MWAESLFIRAAVVDGPRALTGRGRRVGTRSVVVQDLETAAGEKWGSRIVLWRPGNRASTIGIGPAILARLASAELRGIDPSNTADRPDHRHAAGTGDRFIRRIRTGNISGATDILDHEHCAAQPIRNVGHSRTVQRHRRIDVGVQGNTILHLVAQSRRGIDVRVDQRHIVRATVAQNVGSSKAVAGTQKRADLGVRYRCILAVGTVGVMIVEVETLIKR